jgi:hypothetical protein
VRRLLLVVGAALAISGIIASPASAATKCRGSHWGNTAGGYSVHYDRYRALAPHEASEVYRQMNCASVRYAVRAVHRKVRKQRGWPHVPHRFFDGYVTWDCYKTSRLRVQCVEYDSNTGFRFRARVY